MSYLGSSSQRSNLIKQSVTQQLKPCSQSRTTSQQHVFTALPVRRQQPQIIIIIIVYVVPHCSLQQREGVFEVHLRKHLIKGMKPSSDLAWLLLKWDSKHSENGTALDTSQTSLGENSPTVSINTGWGFLGQSEGFGVNK